MAAPLIQSSLPKFTLNQLAFKCILRKQYRRQQNVIKSLVRYYSENCHSQIRVRFAPSPTGFIHLGGLRTALYNFLFARSKNGKFILRIEDTDQTRSVPGAIEKIQNALQWVGITPDEGPDQKGEHGPYLQSERLEFYHSHMQKLLDNGWAYPCFCTSRRLELMRKEAAMKGEPSKYDNRCRSLSQAQVEEKKAAGISYVIRLKLEPTPDPWDDMVMGATSHNIADIEGDPVLLKSDGYPTYHFANVVDDHLMEVSHVLRGSEWLSSTPKHILLYKAFGWRPPKFGHLPLIVNPDGTKLSKRQGDIHVEYFRVSGERLVNRQTDPAQEVNPQAMSRAQCLRSVIPNFNASGAITFRPSPAIITQDMGYFSQAVLNYITSIGGGFHKSTRNMTLADMCEVFDVSSIRRHPGRLSPVWLQEANRHIINTMVTSNNDRIKSELAEQVRELVVSKFNNRLEAGPLRDQILSDEYILNVIQWTLLDERTSVLSDFIQPDMQYLWVAPSQSNLKILTSIDDRVEPIIADLRDWISGTQDFSIEHLGTELRSFAATQKTKSSKLFALMRMALTGLKQGPPVAEMMSVIGKENVLMRLDNSLRSLRQA